MINTPRRAAPIKRDLEEKMAEFERYDLEKIPYGELLERMRRSRAESVRIFPLHITASQLAVVFFDSLRKTTARWLDDTEGILASRLVTGLHNLESALPSTHIWDLSRTVKALPGARAHLQGKRARGDTRGPAGRRVPSGEGVPRVPRLVSRRSLVTGASSRRR